MAFCALIAVLLIEQLLPLNVYLVVHRPLTRLARFVELHANAGERQQALIAWFLLSVGLSLITFFVYLGLVAVSPVLGWAFSALVLYLMLAFRQESHHFYRVQRALQKDDLSRAWRAWREWQGMTPDGSAPGAREDPGVPGAAARIASQSIASALLASHRHVFGVMVCFCLLPGPSGAVLYRVASIVADVWGARTLPEGGHFSAVARQFFFYIDWLPARVSAAAFAVAGDFESAVFAWKTNGGEALSSQLDANSRVVLNSGAGALGVRLVGVGVRDGDAETAGFGAGRPADTDSVRRTSSLLWRVLLIWLFLLMLFAVAQLAQ